MRIAERMGAIVIGDLEAPGVDGIAPRSPSASSTSPPARWVGTTVEPHEVPLAIDELPLVALLGCFAEGETIVTGAEELRSRSATGSRPSSTACAASAPTSRPPTTASSSRGDGGLRGGALQAHGDHRLAMLGAVAGLAAAARASRWVGMDAAAMSDPHFERDLAGLSR